MDPRFGYINMKQGFGSAAKVDVPNAPVAPVAPVDPVAPVALPSTTSSNTILSTMSLPGGLGTIESMTPQLGALSTIPTLDSPFGSESQRVKRAKARLSIAM